jgi:D-tyrosyl-tRNA(Tyr) deacylase
VRALVQRVSRAAVEVDGQEVASIGFGLLVLLGVRTGDTAEQADRLAGKLERLRVFEDAEGKLNLSVRDVGGELLCVSQFTLYGDARKGRRPTWNAAAPAEVAEPLVLSFAEALRARGAKVQTGRFRTHMLVESVNVGPRTILLELTSA